jgi:hypothetical protein
VVRSYKLGSSNFREHEIDFLNHERCINHLVMGEEVVCQRSRRACTDIADKSQHELQSQRMLAACPRQQKVHQFRHLGKLRRKLASSLRHILVCKVHGRVINPRSQVGDHGAGKHFQPL